MLSFFKFCHHGFNRQTSAILTALSFDALSDCKQTLLQLLISKQLLNGRHQLVGRKGVRVQSNAKLLFIQTLSIVVLIREPRDVHKLAGVSLYFLEHSQWEDDHRLAKGHRLADRVVASMGNDQVNEWQDTCLREVRLAPAVLRQVVLLGSRSL